MNWPTVPLGEICRVASGGTPSRTRHEYYGGDVPWVKISDMLQGTVVGTDESITQEGLANSSAKVFPRGTLLLSIFATVGRTAVLGIDAATNQAIAGITPDASRIDMKFLRHHLDASVPELIKRSRGVAQVNINLSILKSHQVPLPPLEEQRRIAAVLDQAEELRAKRRAAIALLDQLPQAIFLEMFGDPISNQLEWDTGKLSEYAIQITDGEHQTPKRQSKGVKLLSARNVKDGYLDFTDVDYVGEQEYARIRKRCDPRRGDILISCSGTIGRVAAVAVDEPLCLVRSAALVRPNNAVIETQFLVELLRTPALRRRMIQRANASSQANLFQNQIRDLPAFLPPLELQRRFATRAKSVHRAKAAQRSSLAELDAIFTSLQSRVFRQPEMEDA